VDVDLDKACPEAMSRRAQVHATRPQIKDPVILARPALRRLLLQMEQSDQDARKFLVLAMQNAALAEDDPAAVRTRQVDGANLRALRHIVLQDGFPTVAMVGKDGVQAAFLLVQHADTDTVFQERMLSVIEKRLRSGQIDSNQYALLTDRVLRAQGKPQRYGSQFERRDGGWRPQPIADEPHVDARRRALGLMSLANYTCIVRAYYAPASP
jgi:hypothetical protein